MGKAGISRWRKCIHFTLEKQSEIQCISVPLTQKALNLAFKTQGKMNAIFGVQNTKFSNGKGWYFEVAEMHSIYLRKTKRNPMHFGPFGPKSIEFSFENQGKMSAIFGMRNTKFSNGKSWYFEAAEIH